MSEKTKIYQIRAKIILVFAFNYLYEFKRSQVYLISRVFEVQFTKRDEFLLGINLTSNHNPTTFTHCARFY